MPHRSPLTRARQRAAWWLLAPALIVLVAVAAWPLLRTIGFAFTDATLDDLSEARWIGVTNFVYLFQDPEWWQAVRNTFAFAALSVSVETLFGLLIALCMQACLPGRGLLRAAVMIPWAIPTIVSAQMWGWMYHDVYGVLNDALLSLGIIHEAKAWTADSHLALASLVAVDVWKTTPFMALLILAALQMLPQECYEAARIDGVSPWRVFWRVTWPLIRPALFVAVLFRTLDAMRVFDVIYTLTGRSPATQSMSIYAREQLVSFQDVGYGSAASTVLFGFIAFLAILLLMANRKERIA